MSDSTVSTNGRLAIDRADLRRTRLDTAPDASRPLADGEARLAVGRFAITAHTGAHAASGKAGLYWRESLGPGLLLVLLQRVDRVTGGAEPHPIAASG